MEAFFPFQGDVLELQLVGQKDQLAFGAIKPDGTFHVESLVGGVISKGAAPGIYAARIVISDDEPSHQQDAAKVIAPSTSNLKPLDCR